MKKGKFVWSMLGLLLLVSFLISGERGLFAQESGTLERVNSLLAEGKEYLAEKELAKAEVKFKEALAIAPESVKADIKYLLERINKLRAEEGEVKQKIVKEATQEAKELVSIKEKILEYEKKLQSKEMKKVIQNHLEIGLRQYKKGQYEEALRELEKVLTIDPNNRQAQKYLEKINEDRQKVEFRIEEERGMTKEKEVDKYWQEGYRHFRNKKYTEALKYFKKVLSIDPLHKDAVVYIVRAKEMIPLKEKLEEEERIEDMVAKGREYYRERDYDKAIEIWGKVLKERPDYSRVKFLLQQAKTAKETDKYELKTLEERARTAIERARKEQSRRVLEVDEAYVPPEPVEKGVVVPTGAIDEEERAIEAMRKKAMEKTVSLDFEAASFRDVIGFLADQARLNLFIDETVFGGTAAGAAVAGEGESAVAGGVDVGATVTIKLKDMPLLEALDILLSTRGLGYEIRPTHIWITSAENTLPIKFFDLSFGVEGEIRRLTGTVGEGEGEDEEEETTAAATEVPSAEEIVAIIEKFVPQPTGSELEILSEQNKLLVKNTRENIRKTEKILTELITPYQVAIESKFVTVGRQTLQELGLEWQNIELRFADQLGPMALRTSGITGQAWAYGTLTSNWLPASTPPTPPVGTFGMDTFTYTRLNYPQFTAILHMLMSKDDSRFLSAPRITTLSSRAAIIEFTTTYRWLETFTTTRETDEDTGEVTWTYSDITWGEQDVGVRLSVTPVVIASTRSVRLFVQPEVSDLLRWAASGLAGVPAQPIFYSQDLETNVMVHDGDTIVLGGLMRGQAGEGFSKVPFLGDIPVLGKLFQWKRQGENRDTLLIFITVYIITSRGTPHFAEIGE